ncbi:transforming growth factor-beta-induced protein ig-h3-like [Mytilus galloprovincialis]|uniref:transforming growth factor-beta-induced protein ig-h3-like n=1 Tax=Mytilus galloprovincialis TaxID=29158 RepID=UPI003F7BC6B9
MFLRLLLTSFLICNVQSKEDIYDLLSSIGCSSFGNLLQGTGYMYRLGDDHSGPYTVFAPSDAAINNLPPEIVKIFNFGNWELAFDIVSYHITKDIFLLASLQNNGLYDTMLDNSQLRFNVYPKGNSKVHTISGANITNPDNTATNGVVHVIDRMLYRFPEVYTTQYVHEHQNLSKISLLIDKGGMHDQLKAQNITMFVPNDEAFDSAPNFNMTNLLMNDTAIANFVSSLIVNSVYFTADLVNGQDLFTSQGSRIRINVSSGNITVNDSGISQPDRITKNGVVHVINKLL